MPPFFVPRDEWQADREESAKRRLGNVFQGIRQQGAEKLQSVQTEVDRAKEEWARKLFDDMMTPAIEGGRSALNQTVATTQAALMQPPSPPATPEPSSPIDAGAAERPDYGTDGDNSRIGAPSGPSGLSAIPGVAGIQERFRQGEALRERQQQPGATWDQTVRSGGEEARPSAFTVAGEGLRERGERMAADAERAQRVVDLPGIATRDRLVGGAFQGIGDIGRQLGGEAEEIAGALPRELGGTRTGGLTGPRPRRAWAARTCTGRPSTAG